MDRTKHFWSRVLVREPHECWPWLGALDRDGYGRFAAGGGKMVAAHRYAVESTGRTIWYTLDHKCRSRSCCNPAHLEDVPHRENVARGLAAKEYANATHCVQGHEFSEENTYYGRGDRRLCKQCEPPHERRTYAQRTLKSHCRNGHEYTPDNIAPSRSGVRRCATCLRQRETTYAQRQPAVPHGFQYELVLTS